MFTRLIALVIAAQIAIPVASAAESPVRRIDALKALVASNEKFVTEADGFLKEPVSPAPVTDLQKPEDLAAVSVAIKNGWLTPADRKFRPNEALSVDDAIQWRLRASDIGAFVSDGADRESLPPSVFRDAVNQLKDYAWTLSPAYNPGDFVSLPDARALFATATGTVIAANSVTYPWQEYMLGGNLLGGQGVGTPYGGVTSIPTVGDPIAQQPTGPSGVAMVDDRSWWPFPNVRVAVIDEPIRQALGLVANVSATPETGVPSSFVASVSDVLADPWQQPMASDGAIAAPVPVTDDEGNVLPSVRGTDLAKYVSTKPFAITMPSLGITDLGIEHPADASNATSLLAPLQRGVGHLFSYPGEGGSVLVYGHSSNYPWDVSGFAKIFRGINKLQVGDKVYVTYGGKFIVYQVTGHQTIPAGDLASVSATGDGEELVLYTCWPPDQVSQRYLVRAVPVGIYSI